jgi:tRNA A37 N6-isopentenylltransferase MiaA
MATVELVRGISLPQEVAVMVQTGRPELAKALTRRLTKKDQDKLVEAIAVYMETAQKMQELIESQKDCIEDLRNEISFAVAALSVTRNNLQQRLK